MLARITFVLLLLLTGAAGAQYGVGGAGRAAPTSPDLIMPAPKIYVNNATLLKARSTHSSARTHIECVGAFDVAPCTMVSDKVPNRYFIATGNSGSFRITCKLSHMAYDDPIVWPGQSGRTHLHAFYGNASTRSASDLANMATSGNSSCAGGTLNRSGYWVPPLVYHRPGNGRDGEVNASLSSVFYYKIAKGFSSNGAVWAPPGFRMIAGSATSTVPLDGAKLRIDCFFGGGPQGAFPGYRFDHIPSTAQANAIGGCDELVVTISFPECWDGVNLDSPDHQSHVAYADFNLGCNNPSFPQLLPQVEPTIHYSVVNADLDWLRFSSDYSRATAITMGCTSASNYCAGYTSHSDWVNGWSTTNINGWGMSITDAIKQECYLIGKAGNNTHSDCHGSLLGSPLNDNNWWEVF